MSNNRLNLAIKAMDELSQKPIKGNVVDFDRYERYKNISVDEKGAPRVFDCGRYIILSIDKSGYITISKIGSGKLKKVLAHSNITPYLKSGDTFEAHLSKQLFFKFWEIIKYKNYNCV